MAGGGNLLAIWYTETMKKIVISRLEWEYNLAEAKADLGKEIRENLTWPQNRLTKAWSRAHQVRMAEGGEGVCCPMGFWFKMRKVM
jgi:hypothetical protein